MRTRKREQTRRVWGYALPGKFQIVHSKHVKASLLVLGSCHRREFYSILCDVPSGCLSLLRTKINLSFN